MRQSSAALDLSPLRCPSLSILPEAKSIVDVPTSKGARYKQVRHIRSFQSQANHPENVKCFSRKRNLNPLPQNAPCPPVRKRRSSSRQLPQEFASPFDADQDIQIKLEAILRAGATGDVSQPARLKHSSASNQPCRFCVLATGMADRHLPA